LQLFIVDTLLIVLAIIVTRPLSHVNENPSAMDKQITVLLLQAATRVVTREDEGRLS
jgi:hypothetical protein